ncbi:HAD family hydrolase [Micromonospora sp. NPDC050980]|uniref:HAD family hydrolase n=1 Tax=Micromonospora sp. NPDC050980 TaxID=3155161 RepID=UPI0033E5599C
MKTIIIDLDDTLIEDMQAAKTSVAQTLSTVALPTDGETIELALQLIRKMWKAHPHRHTGSLAHVSGWEALWLPRENTGLPGPVIESLQQHEVQVWSAILDARRADPARAKTAAEGYRSFRHRLIRALPGTQAKLAELRQNHRLWLATNGMPAHQCRKLAKAGLADYFDRILVSGDVGAAKSHPAFASAIGRELARDELRICLVIGDSTTQDLQLASNGGWNAAHVCPAGSCDEEVVNTVTTVTHIRSLNHVACECPSSAARRLRL